MHVCHLVFAPSLAECGSASSSSSALRRRAESGVLHTCVMFTVLLPAKGTPHGGGAPTTPLSCHLPSGASVVVLGAPGASQSLLSSPESTWREHACVNVRLPQNAVRQHPHVPL